MPKKVWTTSAKLWGNLLPTLVCLPFGIAGVLSFRPERGLSGSTLWLLLAFPIVGWIALNLLGLIGNVYLRQSIARRLDRERPGTKQERYFVGFARPKFRNPFDPHEDIGFLIIHPNQIEFFGETLQIVIDRSMVSRVRFRPNAHTLVLAGRWVSVEGEDHGKSFRFQVEPREKAILIGNLFFSSWLKQRLIEWAKKTTPQAEA